MPSAQLRALDLGQRHEILRPPSSGPHEKLTGPDRNSHTQGDARTVSPWHSIHQPKQPIRLWNSWRSRPESAKAKAAVFIALDMPAYTHPVITEHAATAKTGLRPCAAGKVLGGSLTHTRPFRPDMGERLIDRAGDQTGVRLHRPRNLRRRALLPPKNGILSRA